MGGDSLTLGGPEIVELLEHLWHGPITTKCDDARSRADVIAMAATVGLITSAETPTDPGSGISFGRAWKLTPRGLQFLWNAASGEETLNHEDSRSH